MQELLGGVLGDFLFERSFLSRNVICPWSKNNQCPCRRWRCKSCVGLMQPVLLPSSEDAERMELIVVQSHLYCQQLGRRRQGHDSCKLCDMLYFHQS